MKELIKIVGGEPRVDSRVIAKQINVAHRHSMKLVKGYKNKFEELGVLSFKNSKPRGNVKGGRPEIYAELNEDQSYFLLALSRNTEEVVLCKLGLVKGFGKLRRQAEQRATLQWQQSRLEGKTSRSHLTEEVKDYVDYAKAQGSANAGRYYVNFSNMVRSALGIEQGPRDYLSGRQLVLLSAGETVCADAINAGMVDALQYRMIFSERRSVLKSMPWPSVSALRLGKCTMTISSTIAVEYVRGGFALVRIPLGSKGPKSRGWNLPQNWVTTPDAAAELDDCNIGLAHVGSKTCALDIDNYVAASEWL